MTDILHLPPQPDPAEDPSPSGGWSVEIQTVDNALVAPSNGRGLRQDCGVFDEAGQFVDAAVLYRSGAGALMNRPGTIPDTTETLLGTWMWGGVLLNHFGHFLTESLSRVWAYPEIEDQIDGILFLHKRNGAVNAFHQSFFDLCQVQKTLKVALSPTRVERLLVPGQGMGLGAIAYGTEKHHAFFRSHFAQNVAADGPEKIYLSRSLLPVTKGGAIGESLIEEQLELAGYEIFHPQNHGLEVQIARYKAAKKIIGMDGSALHLAGLCFQSKPDVAVIWRRSSNVPENILNQLEGASGGKRPIRIEEIEYDWIVKQRGRADRFSIGQIDLPAVGRALAEHGFLDGDPGWPPVEQSIAEAQIAKISEMNGNEYEQKLSRTRLRALRQARRLRRES